MVKYLASEILETTARIILIDEAEILTSEVYDPYARTTGA